MKLQAQAVLRRIDTDAPLRLAGVLVAGSFYPGTAQTRWRLYRCAGSPPQATIAWSTRLH